MIKQFELRLLDVTCNIAEHIVMTEVSSSDEVWLGGLVFWACEDREGKGVVRRYHSSHKSRDRSSTVAALRKSGCGG